jgi:hypothetical protein
MQMQSEFCGNSSKLNLKHVVDMAGNSADTTAAPEPPKPGRRSRPARRRLLCPLHPEAQLLSVSPKISLYVTELGQLLARGHSRSTAGSLLHAYRSVVPLENEWLEGFWCEACQQTTWWHVQRHDRVQHSLRPISRELWQQASGLILPEGNPTVSDYSRRQARAGGVQGLSQFRYL